VILAGFQNILNHTRVWLLEIGKGLESMDIYVFGNGNIKFTDFVLHYELLIRKLITAPNVSFILCDFKGTDTLAMELLKTETENVRVYHIGQRPRYLPDLYKTKVAQWKLIGGFQGDQERDDAAIESCTHFLATDFNTNASRTSGTKRNIEKCLLLGKIPLKQSL
jgi:hypothetical protein